MSTYRPYFFDANYTQTHYFTSTAAGSTAWSVFYGNGALLAGSAAVTQYVYVQLTNGNPATGLTHATSGLVVSYARDKAAASTVTLVAGVANDPWEEGLFCEVSSTLCPGLYRIDYPAAAFALGTADAVTLMVKGTGLKTAQVLIPLDAATTMVGGTVDAGPTVSSIPTAGLPTLTGNQLNRRLLQFLSGPCAGERVLIVGQSASNVLQVAPPLTTVPGAGDRIVIL